MASFVVETFVPGDAQDRFAAEADAILTAASAAGVDVQVRVLRSYLVPSDEMGFHVIEADSLEDVAWVTALAGIDVERIVAAIGVGPNHTAEAGAEGPG